MINTQLHFRFVSNLPMPLIWSKERAEGVWNTHQCHLVLNYDTLNQKISEMHSQNENRQNTFNIDLQEFITENEHKFTPATRQSINSKEIVSNLKFWIELSSWTFCSKCSSLQREKFFPYYEKQPETKLSKSCPCTSNIYVVPHFSLIPACL